MINHLRILSLLLLLALLAACGGMGAQPDVEPEAVVEGTAPSATATSTPAATPTLAATAAPTATAAVTAPELAESCAAPEVAALISRLQQAIATENEDELASLIHRDGLEVRMAWWNPAVHFSGGSLLSDATSHDWGVQDGSGFAITGSFAAVALPPLQEDLVAAAEIGCGEILHGATAGLVQLPAEDEGMAFVSLYRPAPAGEIEFDWGTWVVGYEEWQGEPRITTLIYYQYEI